MLDLDTCLNVIKIKIMIHNARKNVHVSRPLPPNTDLLDRPFSHLTSALTLLNQSRTHLNFDASIDADADVLCE